MSIFKYIPNLITYGNLVFGILAILLAFGGNLTLSSTCIILGAFLDFLDGFFARLFKSSGETGKQLDSLADLITFGLAPSIIVFQLLLFLETVNYFTPTNDLSNYSKHYTPYIAFLIPLFAAYRLAKFNIDNKQSDSFIGLPTPANALFFVSIPFIVEYKEGFVYDLVYRKDVIVINVVVFGLLMISNLNLMTLKFKSYNWSENKFRYLLIAISQEILFSS